MNHSNISKKAKIDKSVKIGHYSVIEDDVEIGADTEIGNYVIVKNGTIIGRANKIFSGAGIGIDPQDYHFKGEKSGCVIGDNNIIREFATISRASGKGCTTRIGDHNFVMTYVHVAHNIAIGSYTTISSSTQLGGYVEIGDHANIGGLVGVHQFCRIGAYAMIGANSYLNKDVPPYLLARGDPARLFGVNVRGLSRKGFDASQIENIKELYRLIYLSSDNLGECLKKLKEYQEDNEYARSMIDFANASKRGLLLKTKSE